MVVTLGQGSFDLDLDRNRRRYGVDRLGWSFLTLLFFVGDNLLLYFLLWGLLRRLLLGNLKLDLIQQNWLRVLQRVLVDCRFVHWRLGLESIFKIFVFTEMSGAEGVLHSLQSLVILAGLHSLVFIFLNIENGFMGVLVVFGVFRRDLVVLFRGLIR